MELFAWVVVGLLWLGMFGGGGVWTPRVWAATADVEESTGSTNSQAMAEADMVLGLEESLSRDTELLDSLRAEYDSPDSEYQKADQALAEIRKELEELAQQAEAAKGEGEAVGEEIQAAIESAQKREALAKQRFETAFEERKVLRDKITILEETVKQSQQLLKKLADGEEADARGGDETAPTASTTEPGTGTSTSSLSAPLPGPAGVASAALADSATTTHEATATSPSEDIEETRELVEARQAVAEKQEEAQRAEEDVGLFRERYLARKRELEAVQTLVESAKKKANVALEEKAVLQDELEAKRAAGAAAADLARLEQQIEEANTRVQQARQQLEEQQERARELQDTLAELDRLEQAAVDAAEAKQKEAEKAEGAVKFLENPLHPQNLLRWAQRHGPKLIGIVLLMVVANLLIRLFNNRIVRIVARTSSHGTLEERENRAHTLVSVFRSSASLVVFAGGTVMILDECGVPVGPLLGGAAILGLAIAFGAQRLIGDFFHGFVILLENQYKVNDVIRVAGIAGLVERITLRVTVLRDLEGCLHFVPNGEIKAVTNMTHGWSRALFDIGVAYKEDADRVMEVLMELAQELRKDPKFGSLILDEPQMLGLDAMADSAIVIKFFIKTRPLQQWTVKRELLRRIKRRFDELGIEIPFPHRTVYLRNEVVEGEVGGTERA